MFSTKIIDWYLDNYRKLPWRETKDPYRIWLSEVILQQTRIDQGLPYYNKFVSHFPTVQALANAPEQAVLQLWEGLGYYSRARNLHFSAQFIVNELQGVFPKNYNDLLQLKGIGDYTAAAIASIAYSEAVPAIDGNVYRVLSRVFGVKDAYDTGAGRKIFKQLAQELLDKTQPDNYNQAVMEFGARVCTPKQPQCETCIFNSSCYALAHNSIASLPYKKGKTKVRKRYFNYFIFLDDANNTVIQQRTAKGIWQGLYEFPLFETDKKASNKKIKKYLKTNYRTEKALLYNVEAVVHKLSHQHLYTHFWIVKTKSKNSKSVAWNTLKNYPFPVLIRNFIKKFHPKKNY